MAEGAMSIVQLASQKTATLLLKEGRNYLLAENEPIERLQLGLEWMHCFLKGVLEKQCIWISQIRDFAHEAEDIIDKFVVRISLRDKKGIRNAITRYFWDAEELSKIGYDIDAWSHRLAEFITRIRMLNSQIHLPGTEAIPIPATSDIHRWPFTATSSASQPPSSQHEAEIIIGLDEHVKNLANRLVLPTTKVIYIYGPSGSGKTTLAKKVCNDKTVRSYFDTVVWISGTNRINAREALETIWLNLCGGDHLRQRKRIKRVKDEDLQNNIKVEMEKSKYLVVFDNLMIEGSWDILHPALHVPRNSGSKLMFPTHHKVDLSRVALSDYRYYFEMKPLKTDDRWKLLSKIASRGGYKIDGMRAFWDKVSQLDGWIPLAVVVLGGLLRSKNEPSKWQNVFKELQEPAAGLLLKVLELSYNDLPFHLKCCFVRLANLPPCFEVPVENLYQMWVAEELVTLQPDDSMSPHDKAKDYLNELVKRRLVQIGRKGKNGEIESCGMHSYVRYFCTKKVKEEYFSSLVGIAVDKIQTQISKAAPASKETGKPASSAGKGSDTKTTTPDSKNTAAAANPQQKKTSTTVSLSIRRLHHLAIHQYTGRGKTEKEVLGAIQDRQHLRSLLIFTSRFKVLPRNSWLKSLHGGTSMLRVLHLEDTKMRKLPHQIGELSHLRYLSLRGTKVTRALPFSLGNLLMLETLDLRAYGSYGLVHGLARHGKGNAVKVPNVLWKLESLRRLYLPESYIVSRLKVDSLTQLETLENLELRSCIVEGLKKLTGLRNFTWMIQDTNGMFEKSDREILQGLLDCPSLVAVGEASQGSSETETYPRKFIIKMVGEMLSKKFADTLVNHPGYEKCVQGLTIWGPLGSKLDDVNMVFKNLTSLALRLTELPDPMQIFGVLPVLKELRLSYLSCTGTRMNFPDNSFPELAFLTLELLPELQNLTLGVNCMPKLFQVEIKYCHKLQIPDSLKAKLVKTD